MPRAASVPCSREFFARGGNSADRVQRLRLFAGDHPSGRTEQHARRIPPNPHQREPAPFASSQEHFQLRQPLAGDHPARICHRSAALVFSWTGSVFALAGNSLGLPFLCLNCSGSGTGQAQRVILTSLFTARPDGFPCGPGRQLMEHIRLSPAARRAQASRAKGFWRTNHDKKKGVAGTSPQKGGVGDRGADQGEVLPTILLKWPAIGRTIKQEESHAQCRI